MPLQSLSGGVCFRCRTLLAQSSALPRLPIRTAASLSSAASASQGAAPPPPNLADIDLNTVSSRSLERQLVRARIFPIGSRRRRAALKTSRNIPFEQLPYQCFQEARKVLQGDRAEKLEAITKERDKIQNLSEVQTKDAFDEWKRQNRLRSMRKHLEYLKIQADINDPLVKKRFEDGKGDMNKPIYRYLANRKWCSPGGKFLIADQRIRQMHVVPDILPTLDLTADVSLYFQGTKPNGSNMVLPRPNRSSSQRVSVQPGEFVASAVSELPPRIEVQVFDKGPRLITVAVVDPDVPNVETDGFEYRCHFLAVNIPISPTVTSVRVESLKSNQIILPWSPPYAQKGSPYHRLAVLVFEQPALETTEADRDTGSGAQISQSSNVDVSAESAAEISTSEPISSTSTPAPTATPQESDTATTVTTAPHNAHLPSTSTPSQLTLPSSTPGYIDATCAAKRVTRAGFIARAFADRHALRPIGAHLFRVQWDEWMDGVMTRLGVEGAGEELRRKKSEKLPYKKKDGARFRGAGGSGLGRH